MPKRLKVVVRAVTATTKLAVRLENTLTGYKHQGRWVEPLVDEDDFVGQELVESAINILYAREGEKITIELPRALINLKLK